MYFQATSSKPRIGPAPPKLYWRVPLPWPLCTHSCGAPALDLPELCYLGVGGSLQTSIEFPGLRGGEVDPAPGPTSFQIETWLGEGETWWQGGLEAGWNQSLNVQVLIEPCWQYSALESWEEVVQHALLRCSDGWGPTFCPAERLWDYFYKSLSVCFQVGLERHWGKTIGNLHLSSLSH